MNAFELFGTIAINNDKANRAMDETSGKAHQLASSLGNAFSSVGRTVAKGMIASVGAISALITSSVKNYADYEQLVGGVETLFKESSAAVLNYANIAYETAGVSANKYMETVTSFSASLLQGLGGDTAEAARIADMAILDMSDNANKMGTSMEMIQNAYQGFAKQNYTMLDNLKLGYGGTQAEMARLINDSGVLGDKFKATATNLKSIPFDMQIKAIHEMQKRMGIAGTTALEASTTISGSWRAMSAAWTNLVVGIADDTQDFDMLISNFADSAVTAFTNISQRVPSIVKGVNQLIRGLAPKIPGIIQDLLPGVVEGAIGLISGLAMALPGLMQILIDMLPSIMMQIASAVETVFPILLDSVQNLIEQIDFAALGESIGLAFVDLVNRIPELLASVGNAVSYAWSNIVWPMIQGLFRAIFGVELPDWGSVASAISDGWSNSVWPVIQDLFKAAFGIELPDWAVISENISAGWTEGIWPMIQDFFKTNFVIELPSWDGVKQSISDLWEKVKQGISEYFSAVFSVFTPDEDGTSIAGELAEWWGKVLTALGDTISAIFTIFTEDEDGRSVGERLKEWWVKVLAALGTFISSVFAVFTPDADGSSVAEELKRWWLLVLGKLGNFISSVFGVNLPSPEEVIEKIQSWWEGIKNSLNLSVEATVHTSKSGTTHGGGAGEKGSVKPKESGGGGGGNVLRKNAAGAVFSKSTIFDTRLGLQEVGEAGPEAVAPISVLQGYVSDAVARQNAGLVNALDRVVDSIESMNENMGSNLRAALNDTSLKINNREFGRLVRTVT